MRLQTIPCQEAQSLEQLKNYRILPPGCFAGVVIMKKKTKKNIFNPAILGLWMVLLILFIAELFIYTWCRVQCVRIGYEISKEKETYRSFTALQNNLKIELAHLKSPERLAEIARDQLGLKTPTPDQMMIIP